MTLDQINILESIKNLLHFNFLLLISYPVIGAFAWFVGALCFKFLFKYNINEWLKIPQNIEPLITIMIPAHNEEVVIEGTINYLMTKLNYSNYEVIVMDDGSTDQTPVILKRLRDVYPNLRTIRIEKNKGKAHAFNIGIGFAKGKLILSNDADTVPEPDALIKYVNTLLYPNSNNVAAITANMDVRNRTKIIAKSQTVEFSSIVGIIKRTQQAVLGSIYAYSGANTLYVKKALIDVGLFRQNRATEDISIAWDHQVHGWQALFAPEIMFFMEVPENLSMLYHQRKRWAKGGTEVWLTNFKLILAHPFQSVGRTIMFIDQTLSITWAIFFWLSTILFLIQIIGYCLTQNWGQITQMLTDSAGLVCCETMVGFFQLLASLIIDDHRSKIKYFKFAPFYMLFYWIVNTLTIVTTFVSAVKTILGRGSGVWVSPKRQGDFNLSEKE
ncbi:glycosyltransferase [Lentilactobacillus senioris]|uniref:glycosyltransferase family 2 protein n=1 Tax=Lentilactobacillus senioris TaxID=931534 RepID=UPI003D2C5419